MAAADDLLMQLAWEQFKTALGSGLNEERPSILCLFDADRPRPKCYSSLRTCWGESWHPGLDETRRTPGLGRNGSIRSL